MVLKNIKDNLHWFFIFSITIGVASWFNHGLENKYDVMKPIVEGVIGGIVTSFLLLIFSKVWEKNITPWFENITYHDAEIEGTWHGFLVPYIGIEEIDRLRMQAAWHAIRTSGKTTPPPPREEKIAVDANTVNEDGSSSTTNAELIISSNEKNAKASDESGGNSGGKKHVFALTIGASPIRIRAEINRVGHEIEGRLVEIGGASQIHTYQLQGSFKNLIMCGAYENENRQNIDRGSFSLMLRGNGDRFEGFFASYADNKHKIHPFRCVIQRKPLETENK